MRHGGEIFQFTVLSSVRALQSDSKVTKHIFPQLQSQVDDKSSFQIFQLSFIKFPLKLIYSTEWACQGKVFIQHLDTYRCHGVWAKKYLLTNKHCKSHYRPEALSTLTHSTAFKASKSFEILVKLQLGLIWQRARKRRTILTNPRNNFTKSL